MDDDDDWVGTPPEGRHSRERADPDFWRRQWQSSAAMGAGLLILIVILVVVLLAR
ncbi:MAG TPA: hypothetical protein VIB59_00970 [Solirubrobacteraceae bacterium]|jgi:hypothetical protein